MAFFAPGVRRRLPAIRQQLPSPPLLALAVPEPAPPQPERTIRCPRCGQPMSHRQRIWPRSRWPPLA